MSSINAYLRKNPRNSKYGAKMGDCGYIAEDCPKNGLLCQKLTMIDGDYGPDGTYWGAGSLRLGYLYVIANNDNSEYSIAGGILKYYRAKSRADAIAQFCKDYPGYSFKRG